MRQSRNSMVVKPDFANRFIEQYKNFLLFVYHDEMGEDSNRGLLEKLSKARDFYAENRNAIDDYMNKEKDELDIEMIEAIKSVRVSTWVYLRDTTRYSIFVSPDISQSFAVVGLTDPIKTFFGFSGVAMKTGVCDIGNAYVCDGLISNKVQLGKNYKSEFNEMHKFHKANGMFYK